MSGENTSKELLCGLCQLPIHPSDGLRHFGTFTAHREDRCRELLRMEIERLQRLVALGEEMRLTMEECIGVKDGQTFEARAEELMVTEVLHERRNVPSGEEQIDETCNALGEIMADFVDRERFDKADTCGTAINLIRRIPADEPSALTPDEREDLCHPDFVAVLEPAQPPETVINITVDRDQTISDLEMRLQVVLDRVPSVDDFIQRLYLAGWVDQKDAQHERVTKLHTELFGSGPTKLTGEQS